MPDYIGNISLSGIAVSPAYFPIVPDTGYGFAQEHPIAVHQFGAADAKREQRFLLGDGVRHFTVRRACLRDPDRRALRDFWEARQGPTTAFHYNAPSNDGSAFEDVVVRFKQAPLSWQMLTDWVCSVGVELIEVPQTTPDYALNATLDRFPSGDLADALLDQVQVIIPLIKIVPKMPATLVVARTLAGIRIPGNSAPWDDPAFPFLTSGVGVGAPVVLASDLNPGDAIQIPSVTGTVAYDNIGFGAYLTAPPEGVAHDSYTGQDYGDLYSTGFHNGVKYPSYYTASHGGLFFAGLLGCFTDPSGSVIQVVPVGAGGVTLIVPEGACRFQLGINRTEYGSWDGGTGGANSHFDFSTVNVGASGEQPYPAIYLSDRRCTIGSQLYQARLLKWDGISQGMTGESDDARFVFGNADRVMRSLVNDVDLYRASLQFSVFHVQTGIKVDLWKGEVIDWTSDQGPEFQLQASDGLYELRLPYPCRKICRTCWKLFNDGAACPWGGVGPSSCDRGWLTPNGCHAHQMDQYFGGITATPQQVRIRDNSSGWHGIGRNSITASSQIADSIYDQVISEVYTDDHFPVQGRVAAGREEGDFYDALAVICEGPVVFAGPYTDSHGQKKGHTLDGQFWHGYPNRTMGLREVPGNDPAGATDYFSLSRVGTDPGAGEVSDGHSVYLKQYAAGTAFLEIRRSDQKGIQLSQPTDHAVEAIIQTGLQGWIWTAPGTRTWGTLTNPIWIVINMLLKARGMRFADAATAETQFVVDAAISTANSCDAVVAKLVGDGTDTQFKFRGALQEEKPLKDWITEVLMNCAGYFTWSNGKLKVGLRLDATAVETFDQTNILFGSLQLSPARPTFNHLSASFADQEFDYAANTVTLYDETHSRIIGGATTPLFLKSTMNLVGTSSKSQAARLITMRLREELGGNSYAQWKAARNIAFKTTVLALNTEPGQVDLLNHAEMPSGAGTYRTQGWKLNPDYSIEIQGRTVTPEMYTVAAEGAKAADTTQASSTLDSTVDGDVAVPAAPTTSAITAPGDGTVKLSAPYWSDPTNTKSIKSATWTLLYYDDSSTNTTLSGGIDNAVASLVVASASGLSVGDLFQLDRECLKITSIGGTTLGVARGQCGSTAAAHLGGATVRKLSALVTEQTVDLSNTGWSASCSLPDAYITSVSCHGTNAFGVGADATTDYLGAGDISSPGLATNDDFSVALVNGA